MKRNRNIVAWPIKVTKKIRRIKKPNKNKNKNKIFLHNKSKD